VLLPRARPDDHGVDPAAIAAFIDGLGQTGGVHGVIVMRDGAVLAEGWWEPYGPELRHSMYSVSKSFTSVAIGLAVAEGRPRMPRARHPDGSPVSGCATCSR